MPELPEVEVVRAGLEPAVTAARVNGVTVLDERSLRRHRGPAEDFVDRLTGRQLALPRRRGKFLWIPLAPGSVAGLVPEAAEGPGGPGGRLSDRFYRGARRAPGDERPGAPAEARCR
jgi:hypothetical protein